MYVITARINDLDGNFIHAVALAFDAEDADPEYGDTGHSVVGLGTLNRLIADSEDPGAALTSWGILWADNIKEARRLRYRVIYGAGKRWSLDGTNAIGIYKPGS